jgi:hypothetical protein
MGFPARQNGDGQECASYRSARTARGEYSVASVRRALDQAERGEGKSLADFDRDFRAIHRIGST